MLRRLDRHAPFWLSLVAGIVAWEVIGRQANPAFMVPLSETLLRLWQLVVDEHFAAQFLNSAELFVTGMALSLVVGMPLGLLLARAQTFRIAFEPYIMILYATPMVALIPFILSLMGFGFVPKVLVVFLFAVFPDSLQHRRRRAQHQAGDDRGRALVPLRRMGAMARGHAALHAALHHDRRAPGDRARARRHGRGGILPQFHRARPDHHDGVAEFRHRRRVRHDPGDRPDRHRR